MITISISLSQVFQIDQQNDAQYSHYAQVFEEFDSNFEKLYEQKNYKALKQALETFYKCLQNDDLLIADFSRDGDVTPKSSSESSLIQKAETLVRSLAEYLIHKRDFPVKKRSFYEFLETNSVEPREITIIVKTPLQASI